MVGVDKTSNRSKGAGQLMIVITLIALAAGSASALMFASIISGALISLLLFYLAPLPLMVAGLGWGPLSATLRGGRAERGAAVLSGAVVADGGGARMGTAQRHDRRHQCGHRPRRDLRPALLH